MRNLIYAGHQRLHTIQFTNGAELERLRTLVRGRRTVGGELRRSLYRGAALGSVCNTPARYVLGAGGDCYLDSSRPEHQANKDFSYCTKSPSEKGVLNSAHAATVAPMHRLNRTVVGSAYANFFRSVQDSVGGGCAVVFGALSLTSQATLCALGATLGLLAGLLVAMPAVALGMRQAPKVYLSDKLDAEETLALWEEIQSNRRRR